MNYALVQVYRTHYAQIWWAKWHFRKNRVKCKNVISVGQILIPTNELSAIGFFWLDTEWGTNEISGQMSQVTG